MTTISRGFSGRLVILVSIFTLIVTAAGLAQSSKQEPTTLSCRSSLKRCVRRWPKCRIELRSWRQPERS
jgi:hypothetical protein